MCLILYHYGKWPNPCVSIIAFKIIRDPRFMLFYEVNYKAIARKLWLRQCPWLNFLPRNVFIMTVCYGRELYWRNICAMQKIGIVLNRLQLIFIRFQFLSYYTYLVVFFGFYKATVKLSSETKNLGQWVANFSWKLQLFSVQWKLTCLVLLLNFIARFLPCAFEDLGYHPWAISKYNGRCFTELFWKHKAIRWRSRGRSQHQRWLCTHQVWISWRYSICCISLCSRRFFSIFQAGRLSKRVSKQARLG